MRNIEVKRTVCSKCGKIRTCHIKHNRYYCAECYTKANRILAPLA